jgi:cell division protein FtsI/penicillin-binding protein 2
MRYLFFLSLYLSSASASFNFYKDKSFRWFEIQDFKNKFTNTVFQKKTWPLEIESGTGRYRIDYTFNPALENGIRKIINRHKSDYTSVVIIDNATGDVLAAIDHDKNSNEFSHNLAFSATNPAASVFKVVTAANLLEQKEVSYDSNFVYAGKGTTLYKYQLKDKKNKWDRTVSLDQAFAFSNNVIFGKAAINHSSFEKLNKTALKFGFYENLFEEIDIGSSQILMGDENYNLAELASGFNTSTLISPVHGAVIASIIANNGVLKRPRIIKSIFDLKAEKLIWKPEYLRKRTINKDIAQDLSSMMQLTVSKGTARGAFRRIKQKNKDIEIGGKTGSITGGVPYGKRDWFISYARQRESHDEGISVCVMIVNVKKWYVKSTYLAKEIIEYYYDEIHENKNR